MHLILFCLHDSVSLVLISCRSSPYNNKILAFKDHNKQISFEKFAFFNSKESVNRMDKLMYKLIHNNLIREINKNS